MAAALFGRLPLVSGDDAPEDVSVASAGLLPGGTRHLREVVTVMAEQDLDLSAHCSVQISPELVAASDIVLAMARRHAREVVLLDPGAWGRTFTVKEFVRRGEGVGRRGADEALDPWLERLHHGRRRPDLVGSSDADDVSDPIGGPLERVSPHGAPARHLGRRRGLVVVGAARDPDAARVSDQDRTAASGPVDPDVPVPVPARPYPTRPQRRAVHAPDGGPGGDASCGASWWWWCCGWPSPASSSPWAWCTPVTGWRT